MRCIILFTSLCAATVCLAQVKLPVHFDTDPGWKPLPTYLGNATPNPAIEARDGAVTLRVNEPGKGMKFELPVVPFDSEMHPFLVARYKATALGPGYAFWLIDESQGGLRVLDTAELIRDGNWHTVAVNLPMRNVTGRVRSILTEVQAVDGPASVSFSDISFADEAPPDATVIPPEPPEEQPHIIRGKDLVGLVSHEGWLASPAAESSAQIEGDLLHLSADGIGRGMKWSVALAPALDLEPYHWVAIRYKARNLDNWGDYFVWLGSEAGGLPQKFATLATLSDLRADGEWHVALAQIKESFKAVEIAVQACSNADRGEVWLDSIRFTSRKPKLSPEDIVPVERGWEGSRLKAGSFRTIDLSPLADASMASRAKAMGIAKWFDPGRVTIRGIPFELAGGAKDAVATSEDIDRTVVVPVNAHGSELYVFLTARLPTTTLQGVLGRGPLTAFRNPERFVFEVRYADGVTDEVFPVCVGSKANEIVSGPEVYCIPDLRKVAVTSIGLRNRMTSAQFLVSGVTVNSGVSVTKVPAVAGLPAYVAADKIGGATALNGIPDKIGGATALNGIPDKIVGATDPGGAVRPVTGGFAVETSLSRIDLRTEGGIALQAIEDRCLRGGKLSLKPGPLFEVGIGKSIVTSDRMTVGKATVTQAPDGPTLTVPFDANPAGAPFAGALKVIAAQNGDIRMSLDVTYTGAKPAIPIVNFPIIAGLQTGSAADTWYLYGCKGGIISNAATSQQQWYGGQHPLQVDDVFNPTQRGGLALLTYDLQDIYKLWSLRKDNRGVEWRIEYFPREYQPGEKIETAPTALRAHTGDWREALRIYRQWADSWYKPQVARKKWFQECFNYRQHLAWGDLRDQKTGQWRIDEVIKEDRDFFGRLDYLHIFDFGESHVYGRVGDYNHYDELGGKDAMAAAIAGARAGGVRVGLYIEGYLCDDRGVWAREKARGVADRNAGGGGDPALAQTNVAAYEMRHEDGSSFIYPDTTTEHMMCPDSEGWRNHLAETYKRVAGELSPSGMYIDQYGFGDPWKTCWSREHGHPVPNPPIRGERDTLKAIRANTPPEIATLTEETPNDVNSQYQDGALGYSVAWTNPTLSPHRVDLFRFQFPSFKVFQLTSYNDFVEGGWEVLKYPFFNGDGYWLGNGIPGGFSTDARDFLRKAFAILHDYREAFTSDDVEPLAPTLRPTVYANRFTGKSETVWTLYNAECSTFRGDILCVPHKAGTRYVDAFSGKEIAARIKGGYATIPVVLGPQGVGCVVMR